MKKMDMFNSNGNNLYYEGSNFLNGDNIEYFKLGPFYDLDNIPQIVLFNDKRDKVILNVFSDGRDSIITHVNYESDSSCTLECARPQMVIKNNYLNKPTREFLMKLGFQEEDLLKLSKILENNEMVKEAFAEARASAGYPRNARVEESNVIDLDKIRGDK